ncbi:energy transducer TonB [Acinetobacter oleivorans]|uniref:energy transducer TonB n=1 Tax=Acinetobacter oleivorans TaxID=1148157 RepID=UPI001902199D|nr:energy transducer TonB [Acinetobacter oleivorans]MBJ9739810.1 energy transducer TonB [Acinetobacter oleivorans]MCU4409811.1 energy transducer TonB [Acinetobacter oleivorans]
MSEFSHGSIRKAFLFEQLSNQVTYTTTVNDPFSHNVDVGNDPTGPKKNALAIAIVAVAAAHLGIWYIAKQLPTPQLDVKTHDPVVIEIVKPPEPPKVIEPKIPPVVQKPKIPPVSPKPEPVQKQIETPKPVQKHVEQHKAVEQPRPVAEPLSKNVVAAPVQQPVSKPAEAPAKAADDNLPVTEAKGYAGYLSNPAPEYPEQALDRGWEGSVILRVKVLPNGSPDSVTVKQSSGKKILDSAAVRTVKQWKFSPALKGKTPVEGWVDVPIHYQLPK